MVINKHWPLNEPLWNREHSEYGERWDTCGPRVEVAGSVPFQLEWFITRRHQHGLEDIGGLHDNPVYSWNSDLSFSQSLIGKARGYFSTRHQVCSSPQNFRTSKNFSRIVSVTGRVRRATEELCHPMRTSLYLLAHSTIKFSRKTIVLSLFLIPHSCKNEQYLSLW